MNLAAVIRNDYLPYPPRAISPVHLRTNGRPPPIPFKYAAPHPIPAPLPVSPNTLPSLRLSFRLNRTRSTPLREADREVVVDMGQIQYSEKYFDDTYEYRHVVLPPEVAKLLPKNRLLSENEWRAIGVQQSRGWVHYAIHRPEPHIMLFRRPLNYQQQQEAAAAQMLPK
ncbi:cyclin-dependent kinases regulatory subunit 1-like [Panicum miliaceum]|uniref:Cyclin-dependent kinases regulatory subunit n=1 Tax=Panicum miliaceum TaxID=4540 RepID=A0A3L6TFK4_PANMI|nr:cyclin-dependent kinases regulatory subunit 1-like [Panicum miliaceum]